MSANIKIEDDDISDNEDDDLECIFISDADYEENIEDTDNDENEFPSDDGVTPGDSYQLFYDKYDKSQTLLETDHKYEWVDGEVEHIVDENKIFLSEEVKNSIRNQSKVDIFELFFSKEIKDYIIETTKENG